MKDRLGQEITVGATVLTTNSYYKELVEAKVIRLTPKMVIVECEKNWGLTGTEQVKRDPSQVVIIDTLIK